MRKIIVIIISLLVITNSLRASLPMVTEHSQISLLTCGTGDEVFTKFGHTAIRFNDPSQNVDIVFHWGIFSFDTPNFALRFMLGETDYLMGPFYTDIFIDEYKTRGSSITEQILDLTTQQKQQLWSKLWSDFNSPARSYRYQFVGKNCATKAYDEIVAIYSTNIAFDYQNSHTTYRKIINKYIDINSWFNLGINSIIGSEADRPIGTLKALSFPEYAADAINHCSYTDSLSNTRPIVVSQRQILPQTNPYPISIWNYIIQLLIPLILIVVQIFYFFRHHHYVPVLTQITMICFAIIGLIISFLWFISSHPLVGTNYNILIYSPLLLIQAIVISLPRCRTLKVITSLITLITSIAYLIPLLFHLQSTTLPIVTYWILILTTTVITLATYYKANTKI